MAIADLQVLTEELPGSQIGITVEVPQVEVDKAFERVLAAGGRAAQCAVGAGLGGCGVGVAGITTGPPESPGIP